MLIFNIMNARQKKLLEKLRKGMELSIIEEALNFGTSEMTIRRDFQFLQNEGLAQRTHGGAVIRDVADNELVNTPNASNAQKRIAKETIKLIEPNATIMLSAGTTTLQVAREIAKSEMRLSVVTNSLPIAAVLFNTDIKVLLTGGELRKSSMDLVGPVTEKNLEEFYIDMLISGCDGADSTEGFFTSDMNLAEMEKKSVQISGKVIIVTESHKFLKRSFVKFALPEEVSTIVTDINLPEKDLAIQKKSNIETILV
jgi:DeoR/GlpR family transcriptional regulator of sugar metabolism